MLAMEQSFLGHAVMLVRTGQVEDHLYLRVVESLKHIFIDLGFPDGGAFRDLLFHVSNAFFGPLRDEITHAHQVQFPKDLGNVLQINTTDGAHADHGYFHFFQRSRLRFRHLS